MPLIFWRHLHSGVAAQVKLLGGQVGGQVCGWLGGHHLGWWVSVWRFGEWVGGRVGIGGLVGGWANGLRFGWRMGGGVGRWGREHASRTN
jgi:hypothetical protein